MQPVAGNPVTTLLESGVGNCYPGLEIDIRNLERRFFQFLTVDLIGRFAIVVDVDSDAVRDQGGLTPEQRSLYDRIARDTADPNQPAWFIRRIVGSFGPFGQRDLDLDALGGENAPASAWTAVRLLPEGGNVTLHLSLGQNGPVTESLVGIRQGYLDATGALAPAFRPGEMTQSLCSPWTHDFRDCGCYYWASNHPDIVKLDKPAGAPPAADSDRMIPWQRSVKGSLASPPVPAVATDSGDSMAYYEINNRWQELAIVLDGREQGGAYEPAAFVAQPLADKATLISYLRYAAGVEIGVMQEYLTAAYSLRTDASPGVIDDVRAARAEIMRVSIGEMRHLRIVNDVLRALSEEGPDPVRFTPALGVAAVLPGSGGATRPITPRALTRAAVTDFIEIERPSDSVDGLYARILATLRTRGDVSLADAIALIMAEGAEHYDTFTYVEEWLREHAETDYLIPAQVPLPTNALHQRLQQRYVALLDMIHGGYAAGLPAGAPQIAAARLAMLGDDGIDGACRALAASNFLAVFDTPTDARFQPVAKPA